MRRKLEEAGRVNLGRRLLESLQKALRRFKKWGSGIFDGNKNGMV